MLDRFQAQRNPAAHFIFALGIMPYITASIILQLMTSIDEAEESSGRRRSAAARSHSTRAI